MDKVNVVIIGGGISGLMAATRLIEKQPTLKITLIEKGHDITHRSCPIITGKVPSCINCPSCGVMEGLAGAGAYSDGKYIISTEYGGWLTDFLPKPIVLNYIEQADAILVSHGATTERYQPSDDLKTLCLQHDLHMQQAQVKHLGTDANYTTMVKLVEALRDKITILTDTEVKDVDAKNKDRDLSPNPNRPSKWLPMRSSSRSVAPEAVSFLPGARKTRSRSSTIKSTSEFGSNCPMKCGNISPKIIYEPKIWYRSKKYGDITRMFCFNERGHVVMENTNDILTVNGHAFKEEDKKTHNSNFALLATIKFTTRRSMIRSIMPVMWPIWAT